MQCNAPQELIFLFGDTASDLYFVRSGLVAERARSFFKTHAARSHFGLEARRRGTAVCVTYGSGLLTTRQ